MKRLLQRFFGMDQPECEHVRELMSEYADDELDGESQARVDAHLGICPRCRQVMSNLRATLGRVRALGGREPAKTDAAADRIASSWRDRS